MDLLLTIVFNLFWWPFRLLWLPHRLAVKSAENSRTGISPLEERTIVFWRKFALIGTCVLVAMILGALLWLAWFLRH